MSVSPPHTKMKTINLLETDRNSSGISLDYKKGSAKTTWSSKMEDNQHEKYRKSITWVTPSPSQGQLGSRRVLLRGIYPCGKAEQENMVTLTTVDVCIIYYRSLQWPQLMELPWSPTSYTHSPWGYNYSCCEICPQGPHLLPWSALHYQDTGAPHHSWDQKY